MPQVSIIIPIYNSARYLSACLQSVQNQTFTDFEVLCVNDGSTDNSAELIAQFCRQDARFKQINQKNQGQSVARNAGLEIAKGRYIYYVDSDDLMHSQLLEICVYFIEKHAAEFVCFRHHRFPEDTNPVEEKFKISEIAFELSANPVKSIWTKKSKNPFKIKNFPWSKLVKKDFIGILRFEAGNTVEDIPYTHQLFKNATNVVLLDAKLYFYRDNMSSVSRNFKLSTVTDRQRGLVNILSAYQGHPREHTLKKKLQRLLLIQLELIHQEIPLNKRLPFYRSFELGLLEIEPYGLLKREYIRRRYLYLFYLMLLRRKCIIFFEKFFKLRQTTN